MEPWNRLVEGLQRAWEAAPGWLSANWTYIPLGLVALMLIAWVESKSN